MKFADSAMALFVELKKGIDDSHFGMRGVDIDPRKSYREYQAALSGPAPPLEGCKVPQASPTTLRWFPCWRRMASRGSW